MDPTIALGKARMRVAAHARKYAPDAPVPLIQATTGLRAARRLTATKSCSEAIAVPPGESISSSTERMRGLRPACPIVRISSSVRTAPPIAPRICSTAMRLRSVRPRRRRALLGSVTTVAC
jgi:hypothetical protein